MIRIFTITLLILTSVCGYSQTVTGKVIDENDEGLIGAVIKNLANSIGAVTDLEGDFSIEATNGDVLEFTYIGTIPVKVEVGPNANYNVKLETDENSLGEVIVTGYSDVRREFFTGSATSVSKEDIDIAGAPDVSSMLEGRVAGVTVENVSGTFGAAPRITIRGNTSINGTNKPLWVVDGVVLDEPIQLNTDDLTSGNAATAISSAVSGINPDDIESIEVLRDNSATALYGARAMNGVIVISTKRATSGEVKIGYNVDFSFRGRPHYGDLNRMTSQQEMQVYREMVDKGIVGINTAVSRADYGALGKMYEKIASHEIAWGPNGTLNEDFLNRYENANTDWFDVLFKNNAFQQNHTLSFNGGSKNASFYASLGYFDDSGLTIADEAKRYTSLLKGNFDLLNSRLKLGMSLRANYRDQLLPGSNDRRQDPIQGTYERDFDINPYSYALNTSRSITPYDANGNLEYFGRNYTDFNILHEVDNNYILLDETDINFQTNLDFTISNTFKFSGIYQGRINDISREQIIHESANAANAYRANRTASIANSNPYLYDDPATPHLIPKVVLPRGGFNLMQKNDLNNYSYRNSIIYDSDFSNQRHQVNAIAGQEVKSSNYNYNRVDLVGIEYDRGNLVVTDPLYFQWIASESNNYFNQSLENDRFVGYYLNSSYILDEKYSLNGTIRYDGSNKLGKTRDSRWLPSWNIGGAWNIDKEDFMVNNKVLNNLKVRASYGLSGSITVPGVSSSLDIRGVNTGLRPTFDDQETQLLIRSLENTELTWEKLNELNVGLEFGAFQNRIAGQVDYYNRQAFDLIGLLPTSGIGGESLKLGNYADMDSHGFEVALSSINIKKKDFEWSTGFNIAFHREKITDLKFDPRFNQLIRAEGGAYLGYERRSLWTVNFAGLDELGTPQYFNGDGEIVNDINIQSRDNITDFLTYQGSATPRTIGGFNTTFKYKDLSISGDLSYKLGHVVAVDPIYTQLNDFTSFSKEFINRWALPGDESVTAIPSIPDRRTQQDLDGSNAYNLYNFIDNQVVDGDYVRLRTVGVNYSLPRKTLDKLKINNLSFGVQGRNLLLLYSDDDLKGQDPEFFGAGGVALPVSKMVSFSINTNF